MNNTSTGFPWPNVTWHCPNLDQADDDGPWESIADRQERIPGWRQDALAAAHVLLVGGGGLGSHIAPHLARKGIGRLSIVDDDVVERSNLNRQFFQVDDLYKPKALRLAHNCARQGCLGSSIVGHQVAFDPTTAPILAEGVDLAVLAVDNDQTRALACHYFLQTRRPVIFTAVNEMADYAWVFTQGSAGRPCLCCLYPHMRDAGAQPRRCVASPGALDVLCLAGSLVLYALDSILMLNSRRRDWSFFAISLMGDVLPIVARTQPRPDCPVCAVPGKRQGGEVVAGGHD